MASMLAEEQFRCVICQDVYVDPVSLQCGHNFCLQCIQRYWDTGTKVNCPMCKQAYVRRPDTRVNVALRDITEHFRRQTLNPPRKPTVPARRTRSTGTADLVLCDVCTGTKQPASQSCLVCQVSYCQTHLRPHLGDPVMAAHALTAPVASAAARRCRSHNKRLELFCVDHRTPVCADCTEHRSHKVVSMEKESQRVKALLRTTEARLRQTLESRTRTQEEVQAALLDGKAKKERELQRGAEVFDVVREALERNHAALVDEIEWKQEVLEKAAGEQLDRLGEETGELRRRCGELRLLEAAQDPLYLLQSFAGLSTALPAGDRTAVTGAASYTGAVRSALSSLVTACCDVEQQLSAEELSQRRKHAVDVFLDAETAACWLILSPDRKKVNLGVQPQRVTDNPRRFDSCVSVLGTEGFTSGRRYWEVQVGDKTDWDLGVARESVTRKGAITVRPDNGYWAICRRKGGSLSACAGPSVTLRLHEPPRKVGVFLDYEAGLVSFYNAEARSHVYTYAGCSFAGRLFPYFNPGLHDSGRNMAPLVVCPLAELLAEETAVL